MWLAYRCTEKDWKLTYIVDGELASFQRLTRHFYPFANMVCNDRVNGKLDSGGGGSRRSR